VAEGHAFGLHADAAVRRGLTSGEAINLIVDNDVWQVDVAAHGVNEVVATDPEAVAVAASDPDGQIVISKLHTSRHGQGPAMQSVHAICIDVTREIGDRKSTRLNSSHQIISYAVFCLKKKKKNKNNQ